MTKKKKIIICLVIIFVIFTILMIYIIANRKNNLNLDAPIPDDYYAVNETKSKVDEKTEQTNKKVVNEVTFDNLNELNHEQIADKEDLFNIVLRSISTEETVHGKATEVRVLEYSDEGLIYLSISFKDKTTQTYISVYDDYNTHSFLNCVPLEQWEFYHSDENKG